MLGLPLSSTSPVLPLSGEVPHYNIYGNPCRAPPTNSPPFTLLGNAPVHSNMVFLLKLTLKPKFLKLTQFASLGVVFPKCSLLVHLKFAKILYKHPPKHCLNPSTIDTQFNDFFSMISINFNKNAKLTHSSPLPNTSP